MSDSQSSLTGVTAILRYNWHFYAVSVCAIVVMAALPWVYALPEAIIAVVVCAIAMTSFWTLSSILVSYYVYDYRGVTRWEWLRASLLFTPRRWLNIHAGLDESSRALQRFFPDAESKIVDIYDSREMTEPSIARARRIHQRGPAIEATLDALPFANESCDSLFLLMAAHEIRQPERRQRFFDECARVLSGGGQMILAEHMRDWNNFLAFGPGFVHFFPEREWLRLARKAGLKVEHGESITPFVRCFVMTKATR